MSPKGLPSSVCGAGHEESKPQLESQPVEEVKLEAGAAAEPADVAHDPMPMGEAGLANGAPSL